MADLLWLVPALPLLAFVLITFFLRRPQKASGYLSVLAIAGSFVISVLTLLEGMRAPAPWRIDITIPWFELGNAVTRKPHTKSSRNFAQK